jgi:hypothetical protein
MSVTAASSRLLVALLALSAAPAAAQAPSEADAAFKKGRDLLKAGKYAEACVEFERSEWLDPELGTRFNIAQCDEKQGKLAAALELYRELADKDTNATRKQVSAEALAALEPRVPHVQLQIDPKPLPAGLVVKIGEHTVPCTASTCEARVDVGHHVATASAAGCKPATGDVDVASEGATVVVKLALSCSQDVAGVVHATSVPPPPTEPSPSHRKTYALVAIAGGGAIIATGAVFGVLARGNWNDAKAACGGSTACPDPASLAKASSLRDSASGKATIATGLFVAGGIAAAAGVVLWLTAPGNEHAIAVSPAGTGVSLSGRF